MAGGRTILYVLPKDVENEPFVLIDIIITIMVKSSSLDDNIVRLTINVYPGHGILCYLSDVE